MSTRAYSRLPAIGLFLGLVAIITVGVWRYGYLQALSQLSAQASVDLTLAVDRFTRQLERYRDQAVGLAVPRGARGQAGLLAAADKTSAMGIAWVDAAGRIAVQAGTLPPGLLEGDAYARALTGALGSGHGRIGAAGPRFYVYAAPRFSGHEVIGVMIVVVDLEEVEWSWSGAQPAVYFTTGDGRVFLSNRSDILGWQLPVGAEGLAPADGPAPQFDSRQIAGHSLWRMGWGEYLPARALYLSREVPLLGMSAHVLRDVASARLLAGLQALIVALICLAFGALLWLAASRRAQLSRINTHLEARVERRTRALLNANTALRHEIAERKEAEAALKRAQAELVQAGKLSALGQLSAGISHELNQPLMAIGQYAENGGAFLAQGQTGLAGSNLDKIGRLSRRMARIISNLRAFARQESAPVTRVDLGAAIEQALELAEPRLRAAGVRVDWQRPPAPVWVRGGEVRLGQVFLNLITNAIDAMEGQAVKTIALRLMPGDPVRATVTDNGPGIEAPDKMFEPFYSTKSVGEEDGMGLGLSISYGLVQSFGGDIRGRNHEDGGAVFTVSLAPWQAEAER